MKLLKIILLLFVALNGNSQTSDDDQKSLRHYEEARAFFVLGKAKRSQHATLQLIERSSSGHGDLIDLKIPYLCFLYMEDARRLKNRVEFEHWKEVGYKYFKTKDCGTAKNALLKDIYETFMERFKLSDDTKNAKKYHRFYKRAAKKRKKFFRY